MSANLGLALDQSSFAAGPSTLAAGNGGHGAEALSGAAYQQPWGGGHVQERLAGLVAQRPGGAKPSTAAAPTVPPATPAER